MTTNLQTNGKTAFLNLLALTALFCLQPPIGACAETPSAGERAVLPTAHKTFDCALCHRNAPKTTPETIPENAACLACHGPAEKLVEATSRYELNPHMSPHWRDTVPCGTCHKQHSKPVVYCEACHKNQNYRAK